MFDTSEVTWQRDVLEVSPLYATDVQTEAQADEVVRALNDRLWNAFGFDSCGMIREGGALPA